MGDFANHGAKVMYLDANGYDYQRERFRQLGFHHGSILTVKQIDIGGFSSTYEFEEVEGEFNTVMFAVLTPFQN